MPATPRVRTFYEGTAMRHNQRGFVGQAFVVVISLIALFILGFVAQRNVLPHVGAHEVPGWYGVIHGMYVLPNLIFDIIENPKNLDIYQSGAGNWYQVGWVTGAALFFGGLGYLAARLR